VSVQFSLVRRPVSVLTIDTQRFVVASRRKDAITLAASNSWLPAAVVCWRRAALATTSRAPRAVEVVPLSSYRRRVLSLAVTSQVVLARAFPATQSTRTSISHDSINLV